MIGAEMTTRNCWCLIWAQTLTGVIARNHQLPWSLPEDLAHFKNTTLGKPVLMGRKTWECLPEKYRPLPDRKNIVITHTPSYHAHGARVITDLRDLPYMGQIWVIGGPDLYTQIMPYASRCEITEIAMDLQPQPGDTLAPPITRDDWTVIRSEWKTSSTGLRYRFCNYFHSSHQN